MYSELKSIQILISLLKQHNIRDIVISAGQSNKAFAESVENDDFFKCYSVVDERSAAFFAIGVSLEKHIPVAISCTASTACCNYLSAITEAYYREIPIVVLTSNYDIKKVDQMKLLSIHQESVFNDVCKKVVQLPDVIDDSTYKYCERLVNEALLELDHHGKGPVHIDIPNYGRRNKVNISELPKARMIRRFDYKNMDWEKTAEYLVGKRVMILCGQALYSESDIESIKSFFERFDCIVISEHMANLNWDVTINCNPFITNCSRFVYKEYAPDVLISCGKHIQFDWDFFNGYGTEHWLISDSGNVVDSFGSLRRIFEFSPSEFFEGICSTELSSTNSHSYLEKWKNVNKMVNTDTFALSHVFAIGELFKYIPTNSIVHLSIFNSIRIAQYFKLPKDVFVYANMGALGIDGSMSTFLGQAFCTSRLSFLIIGDLSFFYDMNSLMIKHLKNNVRILLLNNGGGAEFYQNNGWYSTIDLHTAAKHNHSAENWAKDNNFQYLKIESKDDLVNAMPDFIKESEKPMLYEVITDLYTDSEELKRLFKLNRTDNGKEKIKNITKRVLGEGRVYKIKRMKNLVRFL